MHRTETQQKPLKTRELICVLCLGTLGFLAAQEGTGDVGNSAEKDQPVATDAIPKPHLVERYVDVWRNSPFQREVVATVQPMQKSFERDYAVLGIIEYGDEPVVTLINKKTRQTLRVTREESNGFKLVDVERGSSIEDLTVTVTKDGQPGLLTKDTSMKNAPAVVPRGAPNPGNRNLNPTNRPPARPTGNPVVRPGQAGAAASSVSAANNPNAPIPQKPLPAPKPAAPQAGTAVSTPLDDFDSGPSASSRRKVVLPTRND